MIFCVEDDAGIRDIEVYALQSTGFAARGFADGATFTAALAKEKGFDYFTTTLSISPHKNAEMQSLSKKRESVI